MKIIRVSLSGLFALTLLLLLTSASLYAQERETEQIVIDEEAPTTELLEFLGEWETSDGEWIDPIEVELVMQSEQSDD
jgi:hypothetical protein